MLPLVSILFYKEIKVHIIVEKMHFNNEFKVKLV